MQVPEHFPPVPQSVLSVATVQACPGFGPPWQVKSVQLGRQSLSVSQALFGPLPGLPLAQNFVGPSARVQVFGSPVSPPPSDSVSPPSQTCATPKVVGASFGVPPPG